MRYLKIIFSLILINLLDKEIAGITSAYFIIFPLTFLSYSFYVYKSNSNIGSSEAFFIGLFIVFLYTIPILNLVAPMIGNIFTSHLILGNKLIIKKK